MRFVYDTPYGMLAAVAGIRVVVAMVNPMLRVAPCALTLRVGAAIGIDELGGVEPIAVSAGTRENGPDVTLPQLRSEVVTKLISLLGIR